MYSLFDIVIVPEQLIPLTCSPVIPIKAESISISACSSALVIASSIALDVLSMFTTMPLLRPSELLSPNPKILIDSLSISAIITAIFVVPISIPVMIF